MLIMISLIPWWSTQWIQDLQVIRLLQWLQVSIQKNLTYSFSWFYTRRLTFLRSTRHNKLCPFLAISTMHCPLISLSYRAVYWISALYLSHSSTFAPSSTSCTCKNWTKGDEQTRVFSLGIFHAWQLGCSLRNLRLNNEQTRPLNHVNIVLPQFLKVYWSIQ